MFERYSERARHSLFLARYEAVSLGGRVIELDHLALGLLREDDPLIATILSKFDIEPRRLREVLYRDWPRTSEQLATPDLLRLSDETKKAIAFSVKFASDLGHPRVIPAHVWLGVLAAGDSKVASILSSRSATADSFSSYLVSMYEQAYSGYPKEFELGPLRIPLIDANFYRDLVANPELIHALHWREFERILADILDSYGYEVELQRGTKDGGVDIFAIKRAAALGKERYLLQAKRWAKPVGVVPVREILFLHSEHGVTRSCLATTSRFTRGAWRLGQQHRWQLELKDFVGLQEWIRHAGWQRLGSFELDGLSTSSGMAPLDQTTNDLSEDL